MEQRSRARDPKHRIGAGLAVGAVVAAVLAIPIPADATHGGAAPSNGIYRIPYADGTQLRVTRDHHNHSGFPGNDRIDMVADMPAPGTIVAAASGTVRAIVDIHGNSNGLGDGVDINGNTQNDNLEHSCNDSEDRNLNRQLDAGEDLDMDGNIDNAVSGLVVTGLCQNYNNYVWIEHPNGEWSKYTHLATGSVPGTLVVGGPVTAGQVLGIEADVGRATGAPSCMGPPSTAGCGRHLHHEIAVPTDPTDDTPFITNANSPFIDPDGVPNTGDEYFAGGFIVGTNRPPSVCGIAGNLYVDNATSPGNNTYTANPCNHQPPLADAGGPYSVDEGATVQLDGAGSTDPDGNPLTYRWEPDTNLDDATQPNPTYTGIDDFAGLLGLTVSDQIEALSSTDITTITVNNVAPAVDATSTAAGEGETAVLTATVTDPGTADTHTAEIDWGDGSTTGALTVADLAAGVGHTYGDNGTYPVTVTVTDDDSGVGADTVEMPIGNVDPTVVLDDSAAVAFPGGDHLVVGQEASLPASADGTDPGTDDLTFAWSTGQTTTYFNNGIDADPLPSPFGTRPFAATDQIDAVFPAAGAETLGVVLTDDDGGSDNAEAAVVVTGTAEKTQGSGWWKHQFSGTGNPHIDPDTALGYLTAVNAISSVFNEHAPASTATEAHAVLSPSGGDKRARARAELLVAWLQFASGAVAHDATIPLEDGNSIAFLDLMTAAEATIVDGASSDADLMAVEQDLANVRHAG